MLRERATRQRGAVLLFAIIAFVAGLALTSAMVSVSITDARGMRDSQERAQAFYLAESGLQGSHYELGERDDTGGDGEGTRTGTLGSGTYSVAAVDLGSSLWRLTSTGTAGDSTAVIEEVVELRPKSRFPGAAMTVVGDMDANQILFSGTTDLIIDGANSPGVSFTDSDLYNSVTTQFADAVGDGYLQESDVTGSITNTFQPNNADLSMAYMPSDNTSLTIYPEMYSEFYTHIDNNLQGSTNQSGLPSGDAVLGSSSSPVNYRYPKDQKLQSGQDISGHGTLIFSQNFIMESGSTINWDGNIIIFGADSGNDEFFELDGRLNLRGNLIVVGAKNRSVKFLVKSQGQLNVDGAVTVLADLSNAASKIEFYIENDFNLNGLLTTVASIQQTEFKPGSDTIINGSFQLGRPFDDSMTTTLQLKFDDHLEIYKDDDQIAVGAAALESLGGSLSLPILGETLNKQDVVTRAWRVLPSSY